jgi:hypothetical protein
MNGSNVSNSEHILTILRKSYLELNETQAKLEQSNTEDKAELCRDALVKCKDIICVITSRIIGRPEET